MEAKYIMEIVKNVKDKPNKDLFGSRESLSEELNKTKELIID